MASRQPDRYIPHVCDVFRLPTSGPRRDSDSGTAGEQKGKSARLFSDKRYTPSEDHSDEEHYDYDSGQSQQKGRHLESGNGKSSHHNNYARTLTEKDLKHIERHLSMKKTIRKQISRHLSQAFVESEKDNPAGKRNGGSEAAPHNKPGRKPSGATDYSFTFTKANFAKSESSFLELLKEVQEDVEDDSGHCSPTRDMDKSIAECQKERIRKAAVRSSGTDSSLDGAERSSDSKKSSFWKKLTIRGKSKR